MRAALRTARRELAVATHTFESIRAEGAAKGFDLPYKDEVGPIIRELGQFPQDIYSCARELFKLGESPFLKLLQSKLGISGGAADYYELLIRSVCRDLLQVRLEECKLEVKALTKLLK